MTRRSVHTRETLTKFDADYPLRPRASELVSGLAPGWRLNFPASSSWLTTPPTDAIISGISYTSGYHATSAGTLGYLTMTALQVARTWSLNATLSTMPDAGRYVYLGGFLNFSGLTGVGVRVANGGGFELGYSEFGSWTSLATGGTGLVAGDKVLLTRVGAELRCHRVASGGGVLSGTLSALAGTSTYQEYGAGVVGMVTNSNTARVTDIVYSS